MARFVVIGLSGSGKTTLGEYAYRQGLRVVDLDREVVVRTQRSIQDLFRVEGENHFRGVESEVFQELLQGDWDVVIAGGGTLTQAANRAAVKAYGWRCCWCHARPEVLARRIEKDAGIHRPLLDANSIGIEGRGLKDQVQGQLAARREAFESHADFVLRTDFASREQCAWWFDLFAKSKSRETGAIVFPTPLKSGFRGPTDVEQTVVVSRIGCFAEIIAGISPQLKRVFLFVDSGVAQEQIAELRNGLSSSKVGQVIISVFGGEGAKEFSVLEKLCNELKTHEVTRQDTFIAIGGGAVGDLVGFLASVFLRGVGLVHIPTTLLAMVDSAIGGKTGINLAHGKNLVGTFYPAKLVFCDVGFLKTLSERELFSGFAEVVKYGCIYEPELLVFLEQSSHRIRERDVKVLNRIVEWSAEAKLRFVEQDVFETNDERILLNFGHTFGHAFEKWLGPEKILHGEAIAYGMIAEVQLSISLGICDEKVLERLVELLKNLNLVDGRLRQEVAVVRDEVRATDWMEFLSSDKKRIGHGVRMVCLTELGVPVVRNMELAELKNFAKDIWDSLLRLDKGE